MRKFNNNSFTASLIVSVGLGMAGSSAATAAPKTVQRLAPQAAPQRQALSKNFAKAKSGNAAISGAVPKSTTIPQRNYSFVPGGGVPGKSGPSQPSSGKGSRVQGGGVPGRSIPTVQGGGVPGKNMRSVQSGGVPGNSVLQSLRDANVSRQPSGLRRTDIGSGRQLPSALNPNDLARLNRLQGVKDPSAALKAALNIPVDTGAATKGGEYDPAKGTNFAELIAESQGRTTTGNQDAGAGQSTAPWSRARELAQQQASAVREGVAQGLAELGIRDTGTASGDGGAPYGAPGGAGSSEPANGSYETPGAGSTTAQFNDPRDANIDETTRLAEASLWFPGMTTGPSLDDFANGGDPRTEAGDEWKNSPVVGEYYNDNGVRVVVLENGHRRIDVSDGAKKIAHGDLIRTVDGVEEDLGNVVIVEDSSGSQMSIKLSTAGGVHTVTVQDNDGTLLNKPGKPKPVNSNPNPYADDIQGGEISEQVLRQLDAKFNGMKDPASENGPAQHDVDKLIGVTVARIMSTVNPILDGPIAGSGGAAPTPRNDLLGPRDPSTAPGRGGPKGPKPGITAPVGPPRRALELLSGQSDVATDGATGRGNGGLLSKEVDDSDDVDPANPQQGNPMR